MSKPEDLIEVLRCIGSAICNEAADALEAQAREIEATERQVEILTDALAESRREGDGWRKDAERYRRLRGHEGADGLIRSDCRGLYLPQRDALDSAVDTLLFTTPAQRGEIAGDGKPCNNDHDPDCRWPGCRCRERERMAAAIDAAKGAPHG